MRRIVLLSAALVFASAACSRPAPAVAPGPPAPAGARADAGAVAVEIAGGEGGEPTAAPSGDAPAAKVTAPAVSAAEARAAAEGVWRGLVEGYGGPALEGPGDAPACDEAGCAWRLDVTVRGREGRVTLGSVLVDAQGKQIAWRPGGSDRRWAVDAFIEHRRREDSILRAVEALPEVKTYCARVKAQGLGCLIYVESHEPAGPCPRRPTPTDDCLLPVYVGEVHETHASRFATLFVEPRSRAVVGATDLACGSMSLARWRARQRGRAPTESCD
jgi:hypothetical protein